MNLVEFLISSGHLSPIFMCTYALVFNFFIKAIVSSPCESCMSCRLVYVIASVMFICIFTRQNKWKWVDIGIA